MYTLESSTFILALSSDVLLDLPSPEAALREVLAGASVYGDARADLAPYSKDLVSWPKVGAVPTPVESHLPEAERSWIQNWESHMLRSSDEARQLQQ